MIDLNAIISTAITQAVDSHVRGLLAAQDIQTQELQRMQIRLNDMTSRLEMLSASLHGQVGQQLNVADLVEESVTDEAFMRKLIRLLDFNNVVSNALDNIDLAEKFNVEDAVDDALSELKLLDYIEDDDLAEKITETVTNKGWIKDAVRELSFSINVE